MNYIGSSFPHPQQEISSCTRLLPILVSRSCLSTCPNPFASSLSLHSSVWISWVHLTFFENTASPSPQDTIIFSQAINLAKQRYPTPIWVSTTDQMHCQWQSWAIGWFRLAMVSAYRLSWHQSLIFGSTFGFHNRLVDILWRCDSCNSNRWWWFWLLSLRCYLWALELRGLDLLEFCRFPSDFFYGTESKSHLALYSHLHFDFEQTWTPFY